MEKVSGWVKWMANVAIGRNVTSERLAGQGEFWNVTQDDIDDVARYRSERICDICGGETEHDGDAHAEEGIW